MKKFSMKYNRKSGKKIYIILALLAILLLSLCFLSFQKSTIEGMKGKNEKPVIINPVSMAMTAMKSFIPTYTENN